MAGTEAMAWASGKIKSSDRNKIPVVTAARPVRAPAITPAEDSAKLEQGPVPSKVPQKLAKASAIRAFRK